MSYAGRMLTEAEAIELHASGMELAAHSLHHPDLRTLDDDALRTEIAGSKAAVEALTGEPCATFAYPFGLHDARVRAATADAASRWPSSTATATGIRSPCRACRSPDGAGQVTARIASTTTTSTAKTTSARRRTRNIASSERKGFSIATGRRR